MSPAKLPDGIGKTVSLAKLPGWIGKALKHPMAAAVALSLGVKIGRESTRLRDGEISRDEFKKRTSVHMGSVSGTVAGASIGALLGRIWPGAGSVVGAFAGGMLGEMLGEQAGKSVVQVVGRGWRDAEPKVETPKLDVEPIEPHEREPTRRDL